MAGKTLKRISKACQQNRPEASFSIDRGKLVMKLLAVILVEREGDGFQDRRNVAMGMREQGSRTTDWYEKREFRDSTRSERMFTGAGGALRHPPPDSPTLDTSEQVYISSLALLKMLKHGRAGVPMEVMGLMLGEFVDEYTVRVVDVFAMPQSGTGVSVEAVDHVFQTNMLDMLKQTGRPEMVVGWYHSHPGFGCWLSGVDINTQQSFEALNQRAVAVVVDPIQSVKGKVVIDAFRLINPQTMMLGQEPRQTTSNLGHLNKPSIQALIHGLNRHYYSIAINYRKNELEEKMLLNLHKKKWTDGLTLQKFDAHSETNEQTVQEMLNLAIKYNKAVEEEDELPPEKLAIANVGKQDAKKHLEEHVSNLMSSNIVQTLGTMLDTIVF
ncbi:26S proteasome non-ATPase regulatory subunit 14 homolog [Striga hermonthica]|uniref:26S proteasome non-ATPase regulatory subunit 14 homolog n=1 Tax=Striga hermonthica TaxID=68872 RepID=A0A9N7MY99_STRHE|nr:26S proteasome non-ATPase regulatory subunit 14 homolog [Striga hermonthica]